MDSIKNIKQFISQVNDNKLKKDIPSRPLIFPFIQQYKTSLMPNFEINYIPPFLHQNVINDILKRNDSKLYNKGSNLTEQQIIKLETDIIDLLK